MPFRPEVASPDTTAVRSVGESNNEGIQPHWISRTFYPDEWHFKRFELVRQCRNKLNGEHACPRHAAKLGRDASAR